MYGRLKLLSGLSLVLLVKLSGSAAYAGEGNLIVNTVREDKETCERARKEYHTSPLYFAGILQVCGISVPPPPQKKSAGLPAESTSIYRTCKKGGEVVGGRCLHDKSPEMVMRLKKPRPIDKVDNVLSALEKRNNEFSGIRNDYADRLENHLSRLQEINEEMDLLPTSQSGILGEGRQVNNHLSELHKWFDVEKEKYIRGEGYMYKPSTLKEAVELFSYNSTSQEKEDYRQASYQEKLRIVERKTGYDVSALPLVDGSYDYSRIKEDLWSSRKNPSEYMRKYEGYYPEDAALIKGTINTGRAVKEVVVLHPKVGALDAAGKAAYRIYKQGSNKNGFRSVRDGVEFLNDSLKVMQEVTTGKGKGFATVSKGVSLLKMPDGFQKAEGIVKSVSIVTGQEGAYSEMEKLKRKYDPLEISPYEVIDLRTRDQSESIYE